MIKHQKTIGSLFNRAKSALFARTTPNDSPQPIDSAGSSSLLKGAKRFVLTCCLLGALSTSADAAVTYIQNFNSGTDGWTGKTSATGSDTRTYASLSNVAGGQSGNGLQISDSGYTAGIGKVITGVTPGDTYTYIIWVKIPSDFTAAKAFVRQESTAGTANGSGTLVGAINFSPEITKDNTWRQITLSGTIGAGAIQARIGVDVSRGNATAPARIYFVDTVSFTSPGNPCVLTPQVTATGPLYTGGTQVTVGGVDATATSVKVYENGVEIGDLTAGITAGNNVVTTSALTEGAVIKATQTVGGQESCMPATGITVVAPCNATASVGVTGPLAAGQTTVTVTGVNASATDVTVYANQTQIGTVNSPTIVDGVVVVTTSALIKDDVISATQTLAGQEGCVPATGGIVGGGANASIRLAASLRIVAANAGPIGDQGGNSGPLYFLGASTGSNANGPEDGVVVNADGCWQTITLQAGVSPAVQWSGTTATFPTTGWASFDGLAIKPVSGDTGPYVIYIDDLQNGSVVLQDWETNALGTSGVTFATPRAAGTTSGDLLMDPNISVVSDVNAYSGAQAAKVSWQYADLGTDNWLRLTTDAAQPTPAVRRPEVDLAQPITFRILVLPLGQTAADNMIASQPQDEVELPGSNVSFSVTMGSADPIYSYQWKKNGSDISLATDSALALSNITTGDEGDYTVEVTVAGDCPKVVTSRVASLTVPVQPTVSVAADSPVQAGSNIVVTATATGGALSYAWYKDGSVTALVDGGNISGATTGTLTISNVRKADAGSYKCEVTNLAGSADSTVAIAVMDPSKAVIVATPANDIGAGTNLTLTATAIGTGVLTYEWRQNGAVIAEANVSGANTDTLTITSATAANAGSYHVIVSNGELDSTASDSVVVSVLEAPSIVADLAPETRDAGQTINYAVTTTGSAANFVWKKDGVDIDELDPRVSIVSSANASSLSVSSLVPSDEGTYSVTASNVAGEDSSSAYLTVVGNVSITAQPAPVTVGTGTNAVFTVSALGGNLQYQWKLDGNNVGDNSSTLTIALENAGVHAVTVNVFNSVDTAGQTSDPAALTVIAPPTISSITADQILEAGTNATLEVTLGGSAADLVEWTFDSAVVSSSTTVELTGVTVANMGTYSVIASNFAGVATASVNVTVNQAPTIDVQPASLAVAQGAAALFSVEATGNPLNYQWQFNGSDIAGETTSSLTINNVQTANLGYYTVRVYNDFGSVDSSVATLSVDRIAQMADNFDGYADQAAFTAAWTPVGPSGTLTSATAVSAPNSVNYATSAQRNDRAFSETGAVSATKQVVFSVDFYDSDSAAAPYRQYINLQDNAGGGAWLVSLGLNNNKAIGDDGGNYFMARILGYNGDAYFKLNDGGPATLRSTGWNNLKVIISNTDFKFYVNGVLAKTIVNAGGAGRSYDLVRLGSGLSAGASAGFDNVEVSVPTAPLTITTQPESLTVNVATAPQFSVVVDSASPVTYQWQKDGVNIANATDSSLALSNVQTADQGSYRVIVANDAGPVTSDAATLTVIDPADIVAPALKVLAARANAIYTSSSLALTGTVLDAVGVASVEYDLNGAGLQPADVTFVGLKKASNWVKEVTLTPGTNTLTVVSTDRVGQQTSVGPIKFYYHTASPLLVQTNLNGEVVTTNGVGAVINAISPALYSGNNTNLFVGRTYTLKALQTGYPFRILTNWTATWNGQATPEVLQTNNLVCTFEMKDGMTINANFIDNPFYRFGGLYYGLFSPGTVAMTNSGYAVIKVTPKLAFSAKLFVDGNAVGIAGKLNIEGSGVATSRARVKTTDKPELTVDITLDFANGTESLSGTVSQGADWTANLLANRLVWSKTNELEQAQAWTNSYTMLIPGFSDNEVGPVGTGSATVKVDVRGKAVIAGVAGDMQVIKQATYVSKNGDIPLFSAMYREKRLNNLSKLIPETKGMVMGWLSLHTNEIEHLYPTGQVHWIKTSWTNSSYAGGFTNVSEATGSRWLYDPLNPGAALAGTTQVQVDLSQGALTTALSEVWDVSSLKSVFLPIKTNTYENFFKTAIVPKTGLIKGTFTHPVDSTVTRFQGVLLQDSRQGEGTFMGPGPKSGGKVTITDVTPVLP